MHRKSKAINKKGGFIALTSAIILSAILILIVVTSGFTGFSGRINILDSELKERSEALAEACWDTAFLKFTNDASYDPVNEVVNVGSDSCIIKSITGGGSKTFKVQGKYQNNYFTNLEIILDTSTNSVTSWKEVASF